MWPSTGVCERQEFLTLAQTLLGLRLSGPGTQEGRLVNQLGGSRGLSPWGQSP